MGHEVSKPKPPTTIHFGGENVLQKILNVNFKDDELEEKENNDKGSNEKDVIPDDSEYKENQNINNKINLSNHITMNLEFSHSKIPECLVNKEECYNNKNISSNADRIIKKSKNLNENSFELLVNISVKDPEFLNKSDYLNKENRSPIDIVCVIDRSYSMKGKKLDYLKLSLKAFLNFLTDQDRLSLIIFDDQVERLFPLIFTNEKNKKDIIEKIDSKIKARGGTNISVATQYAVELLKQRRNPNNIASIILLSDGVDPSSDIKIKNLISQENHFFKEPLIIHTFGYGKDHDPEVMSNIADIGNGNFYYIDNDKLDNVFNCLASCLGSTVDLISKECYLSLTTNKNVINIEKLYGAQYDLRIVDNDKNKDLFEEAHIMQCSDNNRNLDKTNSSKNSSSYQIKNHEDIKKEYLLNVDNSNIYVDWNNFYQIKLPNLISGRTYSYIFKVVKSDLKSANLVNNRDNSTIELAIAHLSVNGLSSSNYSIEKFTSILKLPVDYEQRYSFTDLLNSDNQKSIDTKKHCYHDFSDIENRNLYLPLLKAKCGEVLLKAKTLSDNKNNGDAITLLEEFIKTNDHYFNDIIKANKKDGINEKDSIENINNTYALDIDQISQLKRDLDNFILSLNPNVYVKTGGRARLYERFNSHFYQKGYNIYDENDEYYSSSNSKLYRKKANSLKSAFFIGS